MTVQCRRNSEERGDLFAFTDVYVHADKLKNRRKTLFMYLIFVSHLTHAIISARRSFLSKDSIVCCAQVYELRWWSWSMSEDVLDRKRSIKGGEGEDRGICRSWLLLIFFIIFILGPSAMTAYKIRVMYEILVGFDQLTFNFRPARSMWVCVNNYW